MLHLIDKTLRGNVQMSQIRQFERESSRDVEMLPHLEIVTSESINLICFCAEESFNQLNSEPEKLFASFGFSPLPSLCLGFGQM